MNIGIDIDDTISETFEGLIPYAQKYTIEDLKRETKFNMNQVFLDHFYIVKMLGWTEEESLKFWYKYYDEILKNIHIKLFASEVIKKLKEEGHKIYLITARWDMPNANIKQTTIDWLKQNGVEYDKLFINVSDKVNLVKENKIDLFIDDSFSNCKNIVEQTNSKVYLMNTRMNENLKDEKIKRVYSWVEIDYLMKEEN